MADKVRVAFIGAGGLANGVHYPSVASLPDVDLAATCDLFVEKAQATAERWGIPRVYSDYRKMLDEVDPDAVYVIMPPQDLFEPASTVLQQGRHSVRGETAVRDGAPSENAGLLCGGALLPDRRRLSAPAYSGTNRAETAGRGAGTDPASDRQLPQVHGPEPARGALRRCD